MRMRSGLSSREAAPGFRFYETLLVREALLPLLMGGIVLLGIPAPPAVAVADSGDTQVVLQTSSGGNTLQVVETAEGDGSLVRQLFFWDQFGNQMTVTFHGGESASVQLPSGVMVFRTEGTRNKWLLSPSDPAVEPATLAFDTAAPDVRELLSEQLERGDVWDARVSLGTSDSIAVAESYREFAVSEGLVVEDGEGGFLPGPAVGKGALACLGALIAIVACVCGVIVACGSPEPLWPIACVGAVLALTAAMIAAFLACG